MIKKILVLIMVFALIVTATAANKNDDKDENHNDGDAGKGNDDRNKHHDDHDNGDDCDDGSTEDDPETNTGGTSILTKVLSFIPSGIGGSIFGSSDCERVSILTKQLDNETLKARALYNLQIIADDYDLTVDEFIKYKCSKTGLTFYPEPRYGGSRGYIISETTVESDIPVKIPPFRDATLSKKGLTETQKLQITIAAVTLVLFIMSLIYLNYRYKKLVLK